MAFSQKKLYFKLKLSAKYEKDTKYSVYVM